jgi:hypothetical protein
MWSVPRLYKEGQLQLRERLETTTRRIGVSCETVAGQLIYEYRSSGSYGVGNRYQVTTGEDTAD